MRSPVQMNAVYASEWACKSLPGASAAMLRGLCSKQPLALGLPVEDPFQACDPEQARLQRQDAQTDNVTVTRLHNNLLLHHLHQKTIEQVNHHVCLGVLCICIVDGHLDCLFDSLSLQVGPMVCTIDKLIWHDHLSHS